MTSRREPTEHKHPGSAARLGALLLALAPFTVIVLLGSQLYFRHDDASFLLWAKEFHHPFYFVFSSDPQTNQFADYPGMGGYWRPFHCLYTLVLWSMFGPVPGPYFVASGLAFIVAVYCLFRIAELHAGLGAAVLSCLALMAAFGGAMYNLFHINVPISFLFQLAMIYCFWSYLRSHRWRDLVGMLALLVPAVGRQTTPFLLAAVLVATWLEHPATPMKFLRRNRLAVAVVFIAFWLMTLSPNTVHGSILRHAGNLQATLGFMAERVLFYGSLLTGGLTGLLIVGLLGGTVLLRVSNALTRRWSLRGARWIGAVVVVLWTAAIWGHPALCILWLLIACGSLVATDGALRLPLLWAAASLCCFVAVDYYHHGYLLDAAFPLALALGIVLERLRVATWTRWREASSVPRRPAFVAASCLLLALPVGVGGFLAKDVLGVEARVIRTAISTNRNFARLIQTMAAQLPTGAEVYELGEDELAVTRSERPHLSRLQRAQRVKVMGIEDTLVMLRVLDRPDVRMYPLPTDGEGRVPDRAVLIVLSRFESEVARRRYRVTEIREFCEDDECAGMYQLRAK